MKRRIQARGGRCLNLADIPRAHARIAAGQDIFTQLQELVDSALDFGYASIKLTTLPFRYPRVTVNVSGGAITGVTIHDGGWFNRVPTVSLSGGGGTGGSITPTLSHGTYGTITSFGYTAGTGYATSPAAVFEITNRLNFNGQWIIPRSLTVKRDRDAFLRYTGTANEPHVDVGDIYQGNNASVDIAIERATFSTWDAGTQNLDTGVRLNSIYYGKARIHSDGFTNSVEVYSLEAACSYSDIYLGLTRSAQNHVLIHKGPSNNAWINQINWFGKGGSFNSDSASKSRCGYSAGVKYPVGVRFWAENNNHRFNNHTFYDCCFEVAPSVADPWPESVCCQFDGDAANIKFKGGTRHENVNVEFFRHKSGVVGDVDLELSNLYDNTWKLADMWNSVAGADYFDNVKIRDNQRVASAPGCSWVSPNYGQTAIQYDGAGRIYVPGGMWQNPSDNTKRKSSVGSANLIAADSVEIVNTDAFGLHILNNNCRMIAIRPLVKSGGSFLRQQWVGWNAGRTIRYSPAYATATQSGGVVNTPSIVQGGWFTVAPTVTVSGSGGGSGAAFTATLSGGTSGTITGFTGTGGSGYSGTITVIITPNEKDWIQGASFQNTTNFYGAYGDNVGNDTGFGLWLRDEVKELTWYARGGGGSVYLMGVAIESLDGNPFSVISWHGGRYNDVFTKFVNFAPSGTLKGNHQLGELFLNDAAVNAGDAWGYRYRGGTLYDTCVP